MVCSRCGESEVFLRKKGNATGLYCLGCEKWYKWVGKKELASYIRRGYKVYSEGYTPSLLIKNTARSHINNVDIGLKEDTFEVNGADSEQISYYDGLQNQSLQEEESIEEPCHVCISGVIDPMSNDDAVIRIFNNIVGVYKKSNNEALGYFKIKHCPGCGKRLQ